jgi:hydrogenase maturation protease
MQAGIFGVGNELREDDGIGLIIVEKLKAIFTIDSVDLLAIGERLFEIPALIINYSKIAIIDALPPDSDPGKIMVFRYDSNNFLIPRTYSLHDLDLLWQLQYAFWSGFKGEILIFLFVKEIDK